MKRLIAPFFLLSFLLLCGCSPQQSVDILPPEPTSIQPSVTSTPGAASDIAILQAIFDLDYSNMTLAAFHQNIDTITKNAGKDIFSVLSSYYQRPSGDIALDEFVRSTLDYSSQQIYGEPVFADTISYLTTNTESALDLYQKKLTITEAEYSAYLDSLLSQITVYGSMTYSVNFIVNDLSIMTVAERDQRLSSLRLAVEKAFASLTEDQVTSSAARGLLTETFTTISQQFSDDAMVCLVTLQSIDTIDAEVYG